MHNAPPPSTYPTPYLAAVAADGGTSPPPPAPRQYSEVSSPGGGNALEMPPAAAGGGGSHFPRRGKGPQRQWGGGSHWRGGLRQHQCSAPDVDSRVQYSGGYCESVRVLVLVLVLPRGTTVLRKNMEIQRKHVFHVLFALSSRDIGYGILLLLVRVPCPWFRLPHHTVVFRIVQSAAIQFIVDDTWRAGYGSGFGDMDQSNIKKA